jgi:hypothetical protein
MSNVSSNSTSNKNITNEDLIDLNQVVGIAMGVSFGVILLTFLITLTVWGIFIKLKTSKEGMSRLILCLISLAVGALFGDAILNLIPSIFSEKYKHLYPKTEQPDQLISSTIIIVAYLAFFILEKIVKLLRIKNENEMLKEKEKENPNINFPNQQIKSKIF